MVLGDPNAKAFNHLAIGRAVRGGAGRQARDREHDLGMTKRNGRQNAHPAHLHFEALWSLLAIVLQVILTLGIGLIVAPLVVFFRDLERAVRLVLRFLFYASPIIYGLKDLAAIGLDFWGSFNPLAGIFTLYRAAFFPEQLDWFAVAVSAGMSVLAFIVGLAVYQRTIRTVLKEI